MKKRIWMLLILAVTCLLTACQIRTVEQMYQVPKRPESYNALQSVMDAAMAGMEYSAPRTGENQQTVQTADLDGDGIREYLLFAKSDEEKPLSVLIFAQQEEAYVLMDTISCTGSSFDQVEYVQMDGVGGMEIVLGCQLSEQVPKSVYVYTFREGASQQILTVNYAKFIPSDLDEDGLCELLVLRPDEEYGIAELYGMEEGILERSKEVRMSGPTTKLRRIITGKLHGGIPAVFVGTTVEESAIITDVYALIDGVFTNVSLSNESGTSAQTLRNYYVYADDIDEDGEVELPSPIVMKQLEDRWGTEQYLIRWYAMGPDGSETDKMHTYHDFVGGWYLELDAAWANRISVFRNGNEYSFYLWDEAGKDAEKIFTVYALMGQDREEQAVIDNRFVVHKQDSVIYAARLEVASGALQITQDDLIRAFRLIQKDWNTGEM